MLKIKKSIEKSLNFPFLKIKSTSLTFFSCFVLCTIKDICLKAKV